MKKFITFLLFLLIFILLFGCKIEKSSCETYYTKTTFLISDDNRHPPFKLPRESWIALCDTAYMAVHRNFNSIKYYKQSYPVKEVRRNFKYTTYRIEFPKDSLNREKVSLIIRKVNRELYFYEDRGKGNLRGPILVVLNLVELGQ